MNDSEDGVEFDTNYLEDIGSDHLIDGKRRCLNSYKNFTSLEDALRACESDYYCKIVYNYNCDAESFSLCNKLEIQASASNRSCIYKKS